MICLISFAREKVSIAKMSLKKKRFFQILNYIFFENISSLLKMKHFSLSCYELLFFLPNVELNYLLVRLISNVVKAVMTVVTWIISMGLIWQERSSWVSLPQLTGLPVLMAYQWLCAWFQMVSNIIFIVIHFCHFCITYSFTF